MSKIVLNLDDAKAARNEAAAELGEEAPSVEFGGKSFDLPRELPFGVFVRMALVKDDPVKSIASMRGLLAALFGDRVDEFLDCGPSSEDVTALFSHLKELYGVDTGEAEASPTS